MTPSYLNMLCDMLSFFRKHLHIKYGRWNGRKRMVAFRKGEKFYGTSCSILADLYYYQQLLLKH